jgi:GT2 family glycosyltransferase
VHRWPSLWTELLGERLVTAWADRGLSDRIARAARDVPPADVPAVGAEGLVDVPAVGAEGLVDVPAVRGAVFFLGGASREKLGPLDEGYFFFLEETDYCRRAHGAGHRVVFAPRLVARHGLGASSKARAPLAARIEYHRALDRFLRRHRGEGVARVARAWRALRQAAALPFQALLALWPASHSRRRTRRDRFAERLGLVLWHLRGRPVQPGFAEALASHAAAPDRGGRGDRERRGEAEGHGAG